MSIIMLYLCAGLCRTVETPKSSAASVTANVTETGDGQEAEQRPVDKGKEQSVLSKYVTAMLLMN